MNIVVVGTIGSEVHMSHLSSRLGILDRLLMDEGQ